MVVVDWSSWPYSLSISFLGKRSSGMRRCSFGLELSLFGVNNYCMAIRLCRSEGCCGMMVSLLESREKKKRWIV